MDEFHIRKVKENEFLAIAEIAENCPPMFTERNSIYHLFTKFFRNTSLIVEIENNVFVGFLLGFISQENKEDAYIHLLCISPEWRNKGLAKALVKEFLNTVAKEGCRKVWLITRPENNGAINFYTNLGFKIDDKGEKININGVNAIKDYNGPGDHKLLFCKSLK